MSLLLRRRGMMEGKKAEKNGFVDYSGDWLTVQNNVFTEVNPTWPGNRTQNVEIKIPITITTGDVVGIIYRGQQPDYGPGKMRSVALVEASKTRIIDLYSNIRPSANRLYSKTADTDGVAYYLTSETLAAASGIKTYTVELYLNGNRII